MTEGSSDEAWQAGFRAGRERRPLLSNPYPVGSPQSRTWEAGWREAEGTPRPGDQPPPTGTP